MDPLLLNTVVNIAGLIAVALIGVVGTWVGIKLQAKTTRIEDKTDRIDEQVKIIKIEVDGKLAEILRLTARAERAEGRGEAREAARKELIEATAVAALNAVPSAVVAAVPQVVASAEVVPGDVIKVVVEGTVPE